MFLLMKSLLRFLRLLEFALPVIDVVSDSSLASPTELLWSRMETEHKYKHSAVLL